MYKIEFHLKQHTPLIHFQHDQTGATLRASEVKPRLDRFIINHLGNGDYEKGKLIAENNNWIIRNNEFSALNYKLHITTDTDSKSYFITSNPKSAKHDANRKEIVKSELNSEYLNETQYFGNNENLKVKGSDYSIIKKETIKLGLLSERASLKFIFKSNSLYKMLSISDHEILNAFFSLNNFGSRSTKGFGCFLPINFDKNNIINFVQYDKSVLSIFSTNNNSKWDKKLKNIAKEYSLLKRGQSEIRRNDGTIIQEYKKSKLWEYYCSKDIKWEKRKIKEVLQKDFKNIFNNLKKNTNVHRLDNCDNENSTKYSYIRALLGLAEQIEFVNNNFSRTKIKIGDSISDNNQVERFKSPISFIISDNNIFLIVRKININLSTVASTNENRLFQFKLNGNVLAKLPVPHIIDLSDFIDKKSGYTKIY